MAQRAFAALWAIFVLLNGLAAIVVFGCLESFLFRFPFSELALTFFALIVCHDIGKETASNAFDSMLRNVGVIDEFFTSTQEFLLRMPVVEFEGVLGVFGVCVRQYSFLFGKWKTDPVCQANACRCLRVLAVFVYIIIIAKKHVICQVYYATEAVYQNNPMTQCIIIMCFRAEFTVFWKENSI